MTQMTFADTRKKFIVFIDYYKIHATVDDALKRNGKSLKDARARAVLAC